MLTLLRVGVTLLAGGLVLLFNIAAISLGCVVYVYLLPGVIAMKRHYARADRVFIASALAGWTVVGWLAVLAFALVLPDDSTEQILATHH